MPYRGAAPALTDLLAGQIDLRMAAEASQMLPYLKSDTVKAFAIMDKTRWPSAPEIPTIEEAGVPELALSFWQAFWVPKSTPDAVVAKLNAAAVAALADAGVRRRLDELGQEIRRAHSRRRKRSAPFTGRKSTSGGRSSRRPASSRNEDDQKYPHRDPLDDLTRL